MLVASRLLAAPLVTSPLVAPLLDSSDAAGWETRVFVSADVVLAGTEDEGLSGPEGPVAPDGDVGLTAPVGDGETVVGAGGAVVTTSLDAPELVDCCGDVPPLEQLARKMGASSRGAVL